MTRSLIPRGIWTRGPLQRFEREFENMMSRLFEPEVGFWPKNGELWLPEVNVAETEKAVEVTVELPGMKPEEFNVEFKNGELWISGEKKEEKEEKGKTYHRVERRYGQFRRMVAMPTAVEEEKVEAVYKEGVLKVTVPKAEEAKAKHIAVKEVK